MSMSTRIGMGHAFNLVTLLLLEAVSCMSHAVSCAFGAWTLASHPVIVDPLARSLRLVSVCPPRARAAHGHRAVEFGSCQLGRL